MVVAALQYCERNANDATNELNDSEKKPAKMRSIRAWVEFLPERSYLRHDVV
jgi:hypothetical protein